jgi:antitoxin ParD1/3/4
MNVSLTPELERMIHERIASGQYNNASEVIREALRLMANRDTLGIFYDEWLAAQIEVGWMETERGETEPHEMDSIIAEAMSGEIR